MPYLTVDQLPTPAEEYTPPEVFGPNEFFTLGDQDPGPQLAVEWESSIGTFRAASWSREATWLLAIGCALGFGAGITAMAYFASRN